MPRPVTLFTGQWADLPLAELAEKAGAWGFDGLELACWGDHFDVDAALADASYVRDKRELLDRHGLSVWAIEWEDSGMDRDWGAPDALAYVRATDFSPSTVAFDAAFERS